MSAHLWKIALVVTMTHGFRELSRRFGPRWAGLALGLPCSTAVALLGQGSERGVASALAMAGSCQLGLVGAVALPLAYCWSIGRGRRVAPSAALAVLAYLLLAAIVGRLDPSDDAAGLAISALAVLAAAGLTSRGSDPIATDRRADSSPSTSRTLALRTLIPVACLLATLVLGQTSGPGGAGLMSTFPALTLTVLCLTHLEAGPSAAIRMARALPLGNLGMVAFLAAFRFGCPRHGLGGGMALGYLAALASLAFLALADDRWARILGRFASQIEGPRLLGPRRPGYQGWEFSPSPWPRAGKRFSPIVETVAA